MTPFDLLPAATPLDAARLAADGAMPLGGGTTLIDLMKLGVIAPSQLIDLGTMGDAPRGIEETADGLRIGAAVTMADLAADARIARIDVLRDVLLLAASPQIRNMATVGGNLLQRTRCTWFRDAESACNKRVPGSGCTAIGGPTRSLAILGTSDACMAPYPGDMAVALVALDASVVVLGADGQDWRIAVADLHRLPGDTPQIETQLSPGDIITAITLPARQWSTTGHVKVRDRAAYAFAIASAAVVLQIEGRRVTTARIAVGGLATRPWRAEVAEALLIGAVPDPDLARRAAEAVFADAQVDVHHAFKVELGIRTLTKAIQSTWEKWV
jgi:xanthine dehydrogenase YagS FAD-binding subunit